MALRSRDCKATEQLMLIVKGLSELIKETLIWKWHHASLRMRDTKRAPICVGLGMEVHDFVAAVQQKLVALPTNPTGSLFDKKIRVQEADIDFTLVREIKEWAQEQVELLVDLSLIHI